MSSSHKSSFNPYITISDRATCSPKCRSNYTINYRGRSGLGHIIMCDRHECMDMSITINDTVIRFASCSLYPLSLYYKLIHFCTKYSLDITTADGWDIVNITNPTASFLVELNNIIKEYS